MKSFFSKRRSDHLDIKPVENLEIERYLGVWYELARFENRFERGLTDVMAEYSLKEDGSIKVENSGWNTKKGIRSRIIGHAKTTSMQGLLRVSFFWKFYSDYRVLMIDNDYQWSLVGAGNSDYLWILSRNTSLSQDAIEKIITEAHKRGYDTSKFVFSIMN